MKKLTRIVLLGSLLISTVAMADNSCLLKGRWQSNTEMSERSLKSSSVPAQTQQAILKLALYGKMIIEASCNQMTFLIDGTKDGEKEVIAYETVSQTGNAITIRYPDNKTKKTVTETISIINACLAIPVEVLKKYNVNEYFCRI
jgi:hypothetical protein